MVKYELRKLFAHQLFFPAVVAVLVIWIFMMSHTPPDAILMKSLTFWNSLGSFAMGLIILLIAIRIFSMDREEQVEDVLNTTKRGKRQLFIARLQASSLFTIVTFLLFTGIQLSSVLFFKTAEQAVNVPNDMSVAAYFLLQSLSVLLGTIIFTLFASIICSAAKSHPITLISCGLLYGISYITRTSLVNKYSLHWVLDKGFFSYLIRGKLFHNPPIDLVELSLLAAWYGILLTILTNSNRNLQRRRKEI